jgi:hypothetical protein
MAFVPIAALGAANTFTAGQTFGAGVSITGGTLLVAGSITNATWAGVAVGVAVGGTGLTSYTTGDLLHATGTTALSKLAVGSANRILRSTGTAPAWSTLAFPDAAAAGSLTYASATDTLAQLAIGSANRMLRSTGTAPAWSTLAFPDAAVAGSLTYASSTDTLAQLAIGASGTVLKSNGTAPSWAQVVDADVASGAAIGWSKVSKTSSSLADLATRSAGALSSGNLPYAQLPTGAGTWTVGGALSLGASDRLLVGTTDAGSAEAGGIRATGVSQFDAAVYLASGTNAIGLQVGSGDTSALTNDQFGGAIRMNGAGVGWGDLTYHPNGSDKGHFRFSTSGGGVSPATPTGTIGCGGIRATGASQFDSYVTVAGVAQLTSGLQVGTTHVADGPGVIGYRSHEGLWIQGRTGIAWSALLVTPEGNGVWGVPVGTNNTTFFGDLILANNNKSIRATNAAGNNTISMIKMGSDNRVYIEDSDLAASVTWSTAAPTGTPRAGHIWVQY